MFSLILLILFSHNDIASNWQIIFVLLGLPIAMDFTLILILASSEKFGTGESRCDSQEPGLKLGVRLESAANYREQAT